MKKILLPVFIMALFTCTGFTNYAQNANNSHASVLSVSLKNSAGLTKYVNSFKNNTAAAKPAGINCDSYLALVRFLQEQLQHASPAQKPGIIRAIAKAKADYQKCRLSTVTTSAAINTYKAIAN